MTLTSIPNFYFSLNDSKRFVLYDSKKVVLNREPESESFWVERVESFEKSRKLWPRLREPSLRKFLFIFFKQVVFLKTFSFKEIKEKFM